MEAILTIGIILFVGFIFGELVDKIKLPKVTGYILAGILLNPELFSIVSENFVEHTSLITNISLSFITFSVGGTLLFSKIKKLGKSIIYITVFEAELAFAAIAIGFFVLGYCSILPVSGSLALLIALSLLMGSLGSPTDPSATLAISHEYKAKGDVSSTIMGVAAFDDVFGILNYTIAAVIAGVLIAGQKVTFNSVILDPLVIIVGAVILGVVLGFILNSITYLIDRETEGALIVVIFSMLLICFGLASLLGFDTLLSTMAMGATVVNFNKNREKIFSILERYTEEMIFVLFFTISGMLLDFSVLSTACILIIFFVLFRAAGKVFGSWVGASISRSSKKIKKYVAGGLIPQGGIVIGLALMTKQNPAFDEISDLIISVIIGATVIHEIIGPLVSKTAMKKAGEIKD